MCILYLCKSYMPKTLTITYKRLKYLTISMLMLNRLLRIKYLAYLWVKISAKDMSLPSEMHKYLLLRL